MNKKQHGGPGRGQGRHKEPGFRKDAALRFLSDNELRQYFDNTTPRQRVEIVLEWLLASRLTKRAADAAIACPQCEFVHNESYCPNCNFGYS